MVIDWCVEIHYDFLKINSKHALINCHVYDVIKLFDLQRIGSSIDVEANVDLWYLALWEYLPSTLKILERSPKYLLSQTSILKAKDDITN